MDVDVDKSNIFFNLVNVGSQLMNGIVPLRGG